MNINVNFKGSFVMMKQYTSKKDGCNYPLIVLSSGNDVLSCTVSKEANTNFIKGLKAGTEYNFNADIKQWQNNAAYVVINGLAE